jgi:Phage Mu protein F like protein
VRRLSSKVPSTEDQDRGQEVVGNDSDKLMLVLDRIFQAQARYVASKVTFDGPPVDMTPWIAATADACKPILLAMAQQGMLQASARIAAKLGRRDEVKMPVVPDPAGYVEGIRTHRPGNESIFGNEGVQPETAATGLRKVLVRSGISTQSQLPSLFLKGGRRIVYKSIKQDVQFSFDLFNPRVIDAVDAAAFKFCRETMATATGELTTTLDRLRQLLRDGLPKGDAVSLLAKKVRTIFADPKRAFTIAATEGSRAVHGGQMLAAMEVGVTHHTWLASSDACPLCLDLDGKTVKIGEPFYIDPKGGAYASVWHPPLHPH